MHQCKECGEVAQDINLRYCENCGAKMPPPPPPRVRTQTNISVQTTGRSRTGMALKAIDPAARPEAAAPRPKAVPPPDADEQTDPGRPLAPPYEGPAWLARVPGHSPSVVGVGLMGVALVLGILPFFAGVGPFWGMVIALGGWLVTAREMYDAGQRHPLVDWVPPALLRPLVPALYTAVALGLAFRMLGFGLTPLLWLGGAGLLAKDQYGKVYAGQNGYGRFFEPRQLTRGATVAALAGVALCLVALFFTWEHTRQVTSTGPVPSAPPELRVVDAPRPADDFVYSLFASSDAGWDQPFAETLEMLLLAMLGLLALRPEVQRPAWLRFAPIGVVVLGLVFTLKFGGLSLGPVLFLVGLGGVGFAGAYRAFSPEA